MHPEGLQTQEGLHEPRPPEPIGRLDGGRPQAQVRPSQCAAIDRGRQAWVLR